MGANPRTNSLTQYFSTFGGDIVRRVTSETPGAKARTLKNNKTVHELHFGSLTGWLQDFFVQISDVEGVGRLYTLNIVLTDEENILKLSVPHRSSAATAFYYKLANINLNHKIDIHTSQVDDDGKPKTILWIKQGGDKVESYFSKDNLPEPELIDDFDDVGQPIQKWSYRKREAFLNNWLKDEMLPKLHAWHSEKMELVRDQHKIKPDAIPSQANQVSQGEPVNENGLTEEQQQRADEQHDLHSVGMDQPPATRSYSGTAPGLSADQNELEKSAQAATEDQDDLPF